jgi:hypothetical protein
MSWDRYEDLYDHYKTLALALESPYSEGSYIGSVYRGWFIPPASTNYKFYQACDDYCKVLLGNVSG